MSRKAGERPVLDGEGIEVTAVSRLKIEQKIVGYAVNKAADGEKETSRPEFRRETTEGGAEIIRMHEKLERPEMLIGSTYKVKTPISDHAMYVTINDIVLNEGTEHEKRRPFEVFITTAAKQRIREHAEWIATEQAGPQVAADWLTRIGGTIDQLNEMPRRHPVAAEDAWCDYEVRQVTIGQYLIFFTILQGAHAVWVIYARHGRQLTRVDDLPDDVGSLDESM